MKKSNGFYGYEYELIKSIYIYIYPGDNIVQTKFGSAKKRNCALPPLPHLDTRRG